MGPRRVHEVHRGEARAGQPEVRAQRDKVTVQLVQKQADRGGEQRGVGQGCRLVQSHTLADCAQGPSVRRVEDSPTQLGKAQVEDVGGGLAPGSSRLGKAAAIAEALVKKGLAVARVAEMAIATAIATAV